MIYGIGTDIVEISRIKKVIERSPLFLQRVYTPGEREYCLAKKRSAEALAVRFAAKEAVFKAFGTGLSVFTWQDVEIKNRENGRPEVLLHGELAALAQKIGVEKVQISLSHSGDAALAYALVVTKED